MGMKMPEYKNWIFQNIKDADIYILKPIYIERFVMKNISRQSEFIAFVQRNV